jgi:hypothetical protein
MDKNADPDSVRNPAGTQSYRSVSASYIDLFAITVSTAVCVCVITVNKSLFVAINNSRAEKFLQKQHMNFFRKYGGSTGNTVNATQLQYKQPKRDATVIKKGK